MQTTTQQTRLGAPINPSSRRQRIISILEHATEPVRTDIIAAELGHDVGKTRHTLNELRQEGALINGEPEYDGSYHINTWLLAPDDAQGESTRPTAFNPELAAKLPRRLALLFGFARFDDGKQQQKHSPGAEAKAKIAEKRQQFVLNMLADGPVTHKSIIERMHAAKLGGRDPAVVTLRALNEAGKIRSMSAIVNGRKSQVWLTVETLT